jgi:hypothetical protein
VWLYPSLTDLTRVDEHGKRHALPGSYEVSFGVEAAAAHGMGFVRHSFEVV